MKKKFYIKILICFMSVLTVLLLAIQIKGDGFGIDCIPAYLHLCKTTAAIENYDENKINRYIYKAEEKEVYNKLIDLRNEGIEILDRDAELLGTRLDDGFMYTQANIVVEYDHITYMVYFTGTYRNGKCELIYADGLYGNEPANAPECIVKLQTALCTYNPG